MGRDLALVRDTAGTAVRNATADDLIIGLAVAAIGLLAITGIRSMAGLQAARLRPASG